MQQGSILKMEFHWQLFKYKLSSGLTSLEASKLACVHSEHSEIQRTLPEGFAGSIVCNRWQLEMPEVSGRIDYKQLGSIVGVSSGEGDDMGFAVPKYTLSDHPTFRTVGR